MNNNLLLAQPLSSSAHRQKLCHNTATATARTILPVDWRRSTHRVPCVNCLPVAYAVENCVFSVQLGQLRIAHSHSRKRQDKCNEVPSAGCEMCDFVVIPRILSSPPPPRHGAVVPHNRCGNLHPGLPDRLTATARRRWVRPTRYNYSNDIQLTHF